MKRKKCVSSGVKAIETDVSSSKTHTGLNSAIIIKSKKGPTNEPLLFVPKIKPVKWFQIWRYKDKKKYQEEFAECKNKLNDFFGKPETF